jgi:hypothetical protein
MPFCTTSLRRSAVTAPRKLRVCYSLSLGYREMTTTQYPSLIGSQNLNNSELTFLISAFTDVSVVCDLGVKGEMYPPSPDANLNQRLSTVPPQYLLNRDGHNSTRCLRWEFERRVKPPSLQLSISPRSTEKHKNSK